MNKYNDDLLTSAGSNAFSFKVPNVKVGTGSSRGFHIPTGNAITKEASIRQSSVCENSMMDNLTSNADRGWIQ